MLQKVKKDLYEQGTHCLSVFWSVTATCIWDESDTWRMDATFGGPKGQGGGRRSVWGWGRRSVRQKAPSAHIPLPEELSFSSPVVLHVSVCPQTSPYRGGGGHVHCTSHAMSPVTCQVLSASVAQVICTVGWTSVCLLAYPTLACTPIGVLIGLIGRSSPTRGRGRGVMTVLLCWYMFCKETPMFDMQRPVFMAWLAQSERAFSVCVLQVCNCYCSP